MFAGAPFRLLEGREGVYFSNKLRKATLGAALLAAALGGMPMKPEEVEELLQAHTRDEIVQVMDAEEPDDESPDRFRLE